MPQLDVTTFPSQIFWLIVTFVFLYLCVSRIILPRISISLKERDLQIKRDIEDAEVLLKETEKINKKVDELDKETQNEAKKIIDSLKEQTNNKILENTKLIKLKLDKKLKKAETEISSKKKKALKKVNSISLKLSEEILKKVTKVKINKKKLTSIINKNLKQKKNDRIVT